MPKNPLALVGVLLGLVIVILLLVRGDDGPVKKEEARAGLLYPALDTASVDRITIRAGENLVDLSRGGSAWVVASEDGFAADPEGVTRILEALASLRADEVVSRKPEKYDLFELDSARAVEVAVGAEESESARFYIGKSGADYRSTYLRDGARDEVFLQPEALKGVFDRGTRTWKDRALFRIDEEKIAALEMECGGGTIRVEYRGDEGWVVTSPEGYRAKSPVIQGMPAGLTRLTANEFPPAADMALAGLSEPAGTVRIILQDESVKTLLIGAEKPDSGMRYVKRSSDDVLYLVSSSRVLNYIKPAEELIEPVPPDSSLAVPEAAAIPEGVGDE
ncbi:MAG: DUF4340 domain-containing protein [Candidatus Eisenbacteria bacterium]